MINCDFAESEMLCDREPIHIPDLIQPHGVLIAVSAAEYQILQVSLNTAEMLGIEPQELLGKPLTELLGEEQVVEIQRCLSKDFEHINPLPIKIDRQTTTLDELCNAIVSEVKNITGFDRVMVYRFDTEGAGTVKDTGAKFG